MEPAITNIYMFYPIEAHIHSDTSIMKILTTHNISIIVNYAMHAFIYSIKSFIFLLAYYSMNLFSAAFTISLRITYFSSLRISL
jgi:hypothetical protein